MFLLLFFIIRKNVARRNGEKKVEKKEIEEGLVEA